MTQAELAARLSLGRTSITNLEKGQQSPPLSMLPSDLIYRQVYTSFQHDRTAIQAVMAMGYERVMWGTDYPHLEGTYPDTQRVLAELFDGVPDAVRELITLTAFSDLFGTAPPGEDASADRDGTAPG